MNDIKQSAELPFEESIRILSGMGSIDDPFITGCWFCADGKQELRNGYMRIKCKPFACTLPYEFQVKKYKWYQCGCLGTDRCEDYWHYAEECPK